MKRYDDKARIAAYIEKYGIDMIFDTPDLTFCIFEYEKGEMIAGVQNKVGWLLFMTEGTYNVYSIHEDGGYYPMFHKSGSGFINILELTGRKMPVIEAASTVICLALPLLEVHETLMHDNAFLRYSLDELSDRLASANRSQGEMANVEERVLDYFDNELHNGRLENVGTATYELHCSRRQLQRILQKLCDDGIIRKVKKGCYEKLR